VLFDLCRAIAGALLDPYRAVTGKNFSCTKLQWVSDKLVDMLQAIAGAVFILTKLWLVHFRICHKLELVHFEICTEL